MTPRFAGLTVMALATLALGAATIAGAQEARLWLDDENPLAWNEAGAAIPPAPSFADIDPRCAAQARPAELAEDRMVVDRGWRLDGGYQGGWGIVVISAAAAYDGMCRPLQYQSFVFVGGVFAGTLSPMPMDSRTDGALNQVVLQQYPDGTLEVIARYARYSANDPLCCSSRTTNVTFAIDREAVTVRPLSAFTYANQ